MGGGERSNASFPHEHSFSQPIRGYFIWRRRNRYSPPRCFLHGPVESGCRCFVQCTVPHIYWPIACKKSNILRLFLGRKMLSSRVSLAAMGSLKKLPSYSDIELGLLDKEVRNCPPPLFHQVELTYFHTLKCLVPDLTFQIIPNPDSTRKQGQVKKYVPNGLRQCTETNEINDIFGWFWV